MKHKCTGWAIVATMERPDGTWYTDTITDTDDDPEDQFYSITYDLDLIVPTISNILITSDNDYNGTDNGSFTASVSGKYLPTRSTLGIITPPQADSEHTLLVKMNRHMGLVR